MRYAQAKPMVDEILNIAVLFHGAPTLLRLKIFDVLDKHLPDLDPACMERGCPMIETYPPKENA